MEDAYRGKQLGRNSLEDEGEKYVSLLCALIRPKLRALAGQAKFWLVRPLFPLKIADGRRRLSAHEQRHHGR